MFKMSWFFVLGRPYLQRDGARHFQALKVNRLRKITFFRI